MEKAERVIRCLDINKAERHIRGGSDRKYKKMNSKKQQQWIGSGGQDYLRRIFSVLQEYSSNCIIRGTNIYFGTVVTTMLNNIKWTCSFDFGVAFICTVDRSTSFGYSSVFLYCVALKLYAVPT